MVLWHTPFGGIEVVAERLAGADQRVDLFVQTLQACPQRGQELGAGFEVWGRAGGAGQQEPDLLGGQPGVEQPPDLRHATMASLAYSR